MTPSGVRPPSDAVWRPDLTDHEHVALRLLAGGSTHTEIAGLLGVKPETAGQLLHRAQIKLRARTLPHAVARAFEVGLLVPEYGAAEPAQPER